jgi:small-conductance mechanosensitive channel
MDALRALGGRVFFGNTVSTWAYALLIFVVLLTVLPFLRLALSRRLHALKPHQSPTALQLTIALIERTTRLFIVAVSVYVALKSISVPSRIDRIIDIAIKVAVWLQAALWGVEAARFALERRVRQAGGAQLPTFAILRFLSLLLVWALALLMLLANLGVNITALVTSLGIGGVAFALAIQNVLGDIFASLAIALDKPFQLGDELHFGDNVGTVEQIGIKSTRLRCIDGDQLVIANAQLLNAQLHNFGRAQEQRTTLVLTLGFDTPIDTLRAFPAWVERLTQEMPATRFERCSLRGLAGTGFEFETVFYATAPKQTPLPLLRQQFMLRLLEHLQDMRLTFAAHGPAPGGIITAIKPAAAATESKGA